MLEMSGDDLPPGWTLHRMRHSCVSPPGLHRLSDSPPKPNLWEVRPPTGGTWFVSEAEDEAVDWAWMSFGMTRIEHEQRERALAFMREVSQEGCNYARRHGKCSEDSLSSRCTPCHALALLGMPCVPKDHADPVSE